MQSCISVSLTPQNMLRNCRATYGQQLVAHPFSQFRGFPQSVGLPGKCLQYHPFHGMCYGTQKTQVLVNIINSKLDEFSTLGNLRTALKFLHLFVGAAESMIMQ